jgi:sugar lactone lactonase YvrE
MAYISATCSAATSTWIARTRSPSPSEACAASAAWRMKVLLDQRAADDAVGFNDLTVDGSGRIYVGLIAFGITFRDEEMKPGNLHVIDLDGKARKISDGIMLRPRLFAR